MRAGLESVLLQVRRVLVDHAVDLERGEAAGDRRQLARIGVRLHRLDDLPLAVGLLQARRLAVSALDLHFLDVVGLQRAERLLLDRARRQAPVSNRRSRCSRPVPRGRRRERVWTNRACYRLRHQVKTPAPRTIAGMTTIDSQNMPADVLAVSVIRRSAASRGRIAIRLSCCDSQFTVFMNRSRLPSIPR